MVIGGKAQHRGATEHMASVSGNWASGAEDEADFAVRHVGDCALIVWVGGRPIRLQSIV